MKKFLVDLLLECELLILSVCMWVSVCTRACVSVYEYAIPACAHSLVCMKVHLHCIFNLQAHAYLRFPRIVRTCITV